MARSSNPWPDPLEGDDPPVGVSIRPLGADQLPTMPPPPPAPMVPALAEPAGRRTNMFGTPGASAMAQYRRHRAAEFADYLRTLPLRLAGVTVAGILAGLLTRPSGFAALAAAIVAAGLGFLLRFRVSAETRAWRRGAKGEQRTARRLRRLGCAWTVFHDLAIPGSRANADHLAIGPTGVFLIDTKSYRGRLTLTPEGSLWYGHHPLAGVLATVRWEATVLTQALGTAVTPMLCVHGAQLPWGELMVHDVPVLSAGRLLSTLHGLPPMLDQIQVALLAERARQQLHPAA
jgi:Nuclease-related domain